MDRTEIQRYESVERRTMAEYDESADRMRAASNKGNLRDMWLRVANDYRKDASRGR